jgi:hypothetical protein
MFLALFWFSLTPIWASRIQVNEDNRLEIGASCDNLQNRFHDQVHSFRAAVEARASESAAAQARFAMRMHGIIRTLRRAQ